MSEAELHSDDKRRNVKEKAREYYLRTKVQRSISAKAYYAANSGRIKAAVSKRKRELGATFSERRKALRLTNLELERARDRARYELRREKMIAYQKKYRAENGDKIRARIQRLQQTPEFREKANRRMHNFLKTPRGRLSKLATKHKRRAAERATIGAATADELSAILKAAKGRCYYCRKRKPLTFDHIIPLSKGGTHSRDNIVCACGACNSSKGAKDPIEFAKTAGMLLI